MSKPVRNQYSCSSHEITRARRPAARGGRRAPAARGASGDRRIESSYPRQRSAGSSGGCPLYPHLGETHVRVTLDL
eukprot:COSAG02_NODE_34_length_49821_cov_105.420438_54_plen_76_part_00